MAGLPPYRAHFAFRVITPDVADTVGYFITEDLSRLRPHVLVPSGEDDLVRFEFRAICKADAVWEDLIDFLALLHFDLSVDDQLRTADVDVVASAALEVFHEEAGILRT